MIADAICGVPERFTLFNLEMARPFTFSESEMAEGSMLIRGAPMSGVENKGDVGELNENGDARAPDSILKFEGNAGADDGLAMTADTGAIVELVVMERFEGPAVWFAMLPQPGPPSSRPLVGVDFVFFG